MFAEDQLVQESSAIDTLKFGIPRGDVVGNSKFGTIPRGDVVGPDQLLRAEEGTYFPTSYHRRGTACWCLVV